MSIKMLVPILYGNNIGSQFWAENLVTEKQSKHVDIQYHFIRELVEEGQICYSDASLVLSWRSTYPQIVPKGTPSQF
jgi:hypothetical protein